MDIGHAVTFHAVTKSVINITIAEFCFNSNTIGVIIKCRSLIMNVYIPDFIGKQMMSYCDITSMTILLKLHCKYIKQPWFEWKSQVDMNFNMKDMKMIINIRIKILKSQSYRFRFSLSGLYIFNCLMIRGSIVTSSLLKHSREHCLR